MYVSRARNFVGKPSPLPMLSQYPHWSTTSYVCCRYALSALTHSSQMAHAKLVLHEAQDQATESNLA